MTSFATIVIDKSLNREQTSAFDDYAKIKANLLSSGTPRLSFNILHRNSQSETSLQISDCIAGSGFAAYERNESQFYDKIDGQVIYFQYLWKQKQV
jgi:hypothetical protein